MRTKFLDSSFYDLLIDALLFTLCIAVLWQLHRGQFWPIPIIALSATVYGIIKHKELLKKFEIGSRLMKGGALFVMVGVGGYFLGEVRMQPMSEEEAKGVIIASSAIFTVGLALKKLTK